MHYRAEERHGGARNRDGYVPVIVVVIRNNRNAGRDRLTTRVTAHDDGFFLRGQSLEGHLQYF